MKKGYLKINSVYPSLKRLYPGKILYFIHSCFSTRVQRGEFVTGN